jgi:sugar-1,4-lactone oxidase-like protein
MYSQSKYSFTNWARNESCVAEQFFQPDNENEITQILQRAQSEGKKIRTFGTAHSWSPVCLSDDYLLNLDRLQQVINLNRKNKQVTVQAGIKLWQLNEYLYREGFSLKNLGSVSAQSIAGAINTATHGSGINYQILASQVDSFKMIIPSGDTLTLQKEKDAEQFHLALVGLGCLGIISEITLNIDERYHLHEQSGLVDFDEVCDNVLQWIHECEHLKLWWFPHVNRIMVYRYHRTQQPVNDSRFRQVFFDEVLAAPVFRFLIWWGNQKPSRRPSVNNLICNYFLKDIRRVEKNWKVFNVPMPPLHRETEWAFDVRNTPRLLRSYRDMINQHGHLVNFVQEIRFVKGDEFALSPCYQRDSVYFGAYHACNNDWQPLLHDFEQWAKQNNGRPHWGKEFTPDKNYIHQQYPEISNFNQFRKKTDTDNIMMNKFTHSIFST